MKKMRPVSDRGAHFFVYYSVSPSGITHSGSASPKALKH